jgi:hypothetical protein
MVKKTGSRNGLPAFIPINSFHISVHFWAIVPFPRQTWTLFPSFTAALFTSM